MLGSGATAPPTTFAIAPIGSGTTDAKPVYVGSAGPDPSLTNTGDSPDSIFGERQPDAGRLPADRVVVGADVHVDHRCVAGSGAAQLEFHVGSSGFTDQIYVECQ